MLVACSGGADSVLLAALAAEMPSVRVRLAHVNHHLTPESHRWEATVRTLGERLETPVVVAHVDGEALRRDGAGVEAAARTARYDALVALAAPREVIVTGHTASDHLETILLRIAQGAGIGALAGPRSAVEWGRTLVVRPLLGWTRDLVRAACAARDLPYIDDPTNIDPRYLRSAVRPAARAVEMHGTADLVGALRRLARDAETHADLVDAERRRATQWEGASEVVMRRRPLAALSPLVREAVVHAAVSRLDGVRPTEAAVARIAGLALEGRAVVGRGVRAEVHRGMLRIVAGGDTRRALPPLAIDAPVRLGDLPTPLGVLHVRVASPSERPDGTHAAVIDLAKTHGTLRLRAVRENDALEVVGSGRSRPAHAVLRSDGWPAQERRQCWVVADSVGPLWIVGGRRAARALVSDETTEAWHLRWEE